MNCLANGTSSVSTGRRQRGSQLVESWAEFVSAAMIFEVVAEVAGEAPEGLAA
jgi:hypothetical protein